MPAISISLPDDSWAVYMVEVLIDGEVASFCFAADEAEGWVDVAVRDARGRLTDDTERRHGRVEVRPRTITREEIERLAGVRE